MKDFRAVMVRGARPQPKKVRFLWDRGHARLFTRDGMVAAYQCSEPQPVRGYIGLYAAETDSGPIQLSSRCWTCGGHARVASRNADKLWRMGDE